MSSVWSRAVLYLLESGIDLVVCSPVSGEARRMLFTQLKGEVLEEFGYQVQIGILRRSTQLDMCGSG